MTKKRSTAEKSASCRHDAAGLSVRAFARQLGVTDRAIRHAIERGYIPADTYETRRSANGRQAPFITDPQLAAEAWYSRTPVRRGGRVSVEKLKAMGARRLHAEFKAELERVKKTTIARASVRDVLRTAIDRTVDDFPETDQAAARRVLGKFRRIFQSEMKQHEG